jgi:ankyrin repeat protein
MCRIKIWGLLFLAFIGTQVLGFSDNLANLIAPGHIKLNQAWTVIIEATAQRKLNELGKNGQPIIILLMQNLDKYQDAFEADLIDQMIEYVISRENFDPNSVNKDGETVLIMALRILSKKRYKYLQELLELKANPNQPGKSWGPLFEAVARKDKKAATILLIYKADVHIKRADGTTPIIKALHDDNGPMVRLLKHYGANEFAGFVIP